MNKTRMGKRAASLLLSLVMMLSLLPTAAYAAMGNADETQGAIVSENGTGVSDDSNSSGNTDDLQVGDSKDSGNTGDQQVGGSSGSGTADDTTGAEGGADPADSVNGNDSADPQDDGDAVMPVATTVVSTSEELVAAIAAASDGDTITLGEGEFTTYGNTSPKKSLTFEGVGTNTVWTIGDLNQDAKGEGNGDCSFEGCETITFKNMTLKVDNKNYRGFIRINNTVVENCTLEGRTAYWGYETAKFVNATFNAPEGDYALWDYSTKAMTFEGCTFNISGKGVNVYVEAANADEGVTRTVAVNNCTGESTKENKAFLNIKNSTQSYDVTLSGTNTVNGLTANGTTGSALYQVETTEVTETTGKPVTVKQENKAGELETVYEVKKTEKAYVAEVNGVKYDSLQAAIAAAQDGQTVTLLADVEQNTQLAINKSITLGLNGKTIKNTVEIWGDDTNAILSIKGGAKVTITGNGTIAAKENDCYTINVVNGDLTIENGTFVGNISVVQVQKGSLTINGGDFSLLQKMTDGKGENRYLINCIDDAYVDGSAKVAISGGTFVGFDPNVSPEQKVDGKTPSFAAPGVGITKNENGSFTAVDGMTAQILDKDGNSVKAYNTLAEAVAAAEDGQTVRLLADVTLDAQIATGKAITIDGQSKYTIKTVKKLASADGKAGMFYRTQSAKGTLTFLNVTLDGGGVSKIFLNEGGAGETVFDGVTSTNGGGIAYGSGIHISGGGSHATIRNSTLTGSTGTMELNNANYYAANDLWVGGNVYVTVENSVIGNVFVNSAPSATATNGVVHGQLTITGEKTKITYLSGEEEAADKLDKFGNNGSLVKIDSGYVEKVFDKGSYAISGGTFKTEVKKEWCAAGYVPTQNADGTYGVEIGKFTVMVTSRTTGSDSPVANVAGGGSDITYAVGTKVTASAISGYKFVGWFVNEYTGTPYSTDLTCKVKPTDDWTMIAVYEPISGGVFALEVSASKFTVNGGATQRSYLLEKMPVGTQVTVVFKGSENFLYWVNESGKVVSTSKTYTFSMGSATTLKAVYAEKEEHQAMVVFISHTQQVISSKGYTDTQEIQFPEPPIKMGATFVRWSMTEAEIRAAMATTTTGIIVVEPVYEFSAGSYTVTVNYPNDETATYTATVGKITTVTAKSIDGKVFKCWKNGDTVLGYTETLKIAPRGDLTLTAEYVDAGTTVDRLPVIALTEISASQQGAKYAVSFTATRSVPDGYTVTEQGILVSTNSRYGQSDELDAMKLDANGAKPDDTFILKATNTDATGVTVLNGTVSAADRTVYGRAYMILHDSSGAMVYVYSDTILSGSYNSLTTNGGN